ncbi:hypothetical protein JWG45_14140 [Leptospira sp. 201903070]|jgi:hypothetical protein|uniref:Hemerythrin domain-containing protein n=1 Tax=Leptospira ainlahdjerensis TaxID=2810033 RepID=A0ABS2UD42_9LEPT|nr:hypothetical protein [Leptospira ainlahdjerensis]MBM9578290.1 hypothetical protein [Leptospira ainlahdjerensis]
MQTQIYVRQNEVLKRLVIELIRILRTDSVSSQVSEVLDILATMNAKLNEHLMTESSLILLEFLPKEKLLREEFEFCTKPVRNELKNQFRQYITMWSLPSLILQRPTSFVNDSNELMNRLHQRLQSEIEHLFPILNHSFVVTEKIL